MKVFVAFISLFLLSTANHAAQELVHWSDLLNSEITRPYERISTGPDSLQFADLWLPDGPGPHPVAIVIHGGCWQSLYPGVELTNPMSEELSKNRFAVWNIEYRRLGDEGGGYPGTFMDVASAADYLRKVAGQYDLDLNNVTASVHSAGGHLATWLAGRENISAESPLYSENPLPVHRVVSLAGINNLDLYARYGSSPCGHQTVEQLVDLEHRNNAYSDTSPFELLPFSAEHIEIVAAFDSPVPPFFGRHFVQQILSAGGKAELILQPEAGHYEMTAPWSKEWEQVLKVFKKHP